VNDGAAEVVQAICNRDPQFAASHEKYREALSMWEPDGVLCAADISGKRVLDWECGRGVFTALFVEMNAAEVTGIDSWLDKAYVRRTLRQLPRARFARTSLERFGRRRRNRGKYDLVFANTVTEHLTRLPSLLTLCYRLLAAGGVIVLNHDNYYQPVGSHDHGFFGYRENNEVVFLGPQCWLTAEKCATSADFRKSIAERLPWTWDERTDSQLCPDDCPGCPYYRRAQPWGHLIYAAEFRRVFPQPCFTTGYPGSSLNKITPFMLRQFLVEAGFDIERWRVYRVGNQPPPELLQPPFNFSGEDLCAQTIAVRGRKGSEPSYWDLPPFPGAPRAR
jgi:SAM-dependent methyltransferase